ncbi:MAG: glycerate kinase [Candidatus Hadarchaeota archaeon]
MAIKNEKQLLDNAETPELRRAREVLIEVVKRAIDSADPSSAMRRRLRLEGKRLNVGKKEFDLSKAEKVIVVGGGKASGAMAEALEGMVGNFITAGVVNVPKGQASKYRVEKIKLHEATHPLPTEAGVGGAKKMIELVSGLGPNDLVICLLSGGGSALIPLPADGISLDELQETTKLFLKCGADIHETNSVRKHLSGIAGGQLARAAYPAKVVTLVISDVIGDRLDTIASGPTYPDSTSFADAMAVIKKYKLAGKLPKSVLGRLQAGARKKIPDTPKPRDKCFKKVFHEIMASNTQAVGAAAEVGRSLGFNVSILTTKMQGEAREVGANFAALAKRVIQSGKPVARPALFVSGGETTVNVVGKGPGGRSQELVLGAVAGLAGLKNVAMVAFGTDGIDGPTDAAGAIADGYTLKRAESLKLHPKDYLKENAPYPFFKKLGDLVMTGPTGTNVMDVACLVVV